MNLDFKYNSDGLIPAIVQRSAHDGTPGHGRVLMMAWMNRASLEKTVETGIMHYWSRSRQKLWLKGESSGNTQKVVRWFADCDKDTLLFEVEQVGGACHTGYESCFYQEYDGNGSPVEVREERLFDPDVIYGSK
jgi:phosphoribosyl-AMP cyclohydrolase